MQIISAGMFFTLIAVFVSGIYIAIYITRAGIQAARLKNAKKPQSEEVMEGAPAADSLDHFIHNVSSKLISCHDVHEGNSVEYCKRLKRHAMKYGIPVNTFHKGDEEFMRDYGHGRHGKHDRMHKINQYV